jgi:hypothetical protein
MLYWWTFFCIIITLTGVPCLQEGGFDLDMTYITENIIAMGFPAGDLSSGFFGYVEVNYHLHYTIDSPHPMLLHTRFLTIM